MPRARCRPTAWGGVCSTNPSSVVITRIPVIAIAPAVPHLVPLRTSPTREPGLYPSRPGVGVVAASTAPAFDLLPRITK